MHGETASNRHSNPLGNVAEQEDDGI